MRLSIKDFLSQIKKVVAPQRRSINEVILIEKYKTLAYFVYMLRKSYLKYIFHL